MIECTCAREKILTICDSKKINILSFIFCHFNYAEFPWEIKFHF